MKKIGKKWGSLLLAGLLLAASLPIGALAQEPAGETIPVEEDTSSEGPQEVLVEKSVNLNTATLEELDLLPGVGPAIAQRIIDYREQNSGFYDIEEIMEVSGIGEKTFAKLEPYITVE